VLESPTGLRVLVVDDAEEMRTVIRRALGRRGYQVDIAATLAEARALDPGGYDAVLVDAHLGPERGVDLVEALRASNPAAVSRCLVITGGTTDTLPEGVAFLAKPFELAALIDAVRRLHEPNTTVPVADNPSHTVPDTGRDWLAAGPPGGSRPTAAEPPAWQLLRLCRRVRARERHALVDFLHDGPMQDLTAVTLELQLMSRSGPPAPVFDSALRQLGTADGSLRWLVDGDWPFLEPETRLSTALQQRTAWLLAAPITVEAGEQPEALSHAELPVIVDVAELMLLGMVEGGPPAQAQVAVRAAEHLIQIELNLTFQPGDDQASRGPATAQATLDGLAAALGARVETSLGGPQWRAQMNLERPGAQSEVTYSNRLTT
jgi:CheY-like chemotaxis protein